MKYLSDFLSNEIIVEPYSEHIHSYLNRSKFKSNK
jgi:hypothetical protein